MPMLPLPLGVRGGSEFRGRTSLFACLSFQWVAVSLGIVYARAVAIRAPASTLSNAVSSVYALPESDQSDVGAPVRSDRHARVRARCC